MFLLEIEDPGVFAVLGHSNDPLSHGLDQLDGTGHFDGWRRCQAHGFRLQWGESNSNFFQLPTPVSVAGNFTIKHAIPDPRNVI
jgi:hypothetical protein